MTGTIALFHSALGLRPAVRRFADALRAAGHTVVTPDLYDGAVYDELADGVAKRDAIGIPTLLQRAQLAVAALPDDIIYAGFSLGSAQSMALAASRPGARGVVLMHGGRPPSMFGIAPWPSVPVQVHYGVRDPWIDPAAVATLAAEVRAGGARCDVHTYDVGGHLFADDDGPDFDAAAAATMQARVLEFVAAS